MRARAELVLWARKRSKLIGPAAVLQRAGFAVRLSDPTQPYVPLPGAPVPDLIICHAGTAEDVAERTSFDELAPGVPVLSVNLSAYGVDELVGVVGRVLEPGPAKPPSRWAPWLVSAVQGS